MRRIASSGLVCKGNFRLVGRTIDSLDHRVTFRGAGTSVVMSWRNVRADDRSRDTASSMFGRKAALELLRGNSMLWTGEGINPLAVDYSAAIAMGVRRSR
jgi:hypothetical protein